MNPEKVFFTADTHFGHRAVLRYGRDCFADVEQMDAELIRRWNVLVPHDGHVFHLGDVSFRKTRETADILDQLKGRKYLIEGNHDKGMAAVCKEFFEWVKPYHVLKLDGVRAVLCHYAFRSWDRMHYGTWNLHGHSHGNLPLFGRQLDVGVDCWSYAPVSFAELRDAMAARPFESEDHHK